MKIILAALLLLSAPCWAQQNGAVVSFSQEGRASQELRASGLQVRHPSLPIGSRVMVQNMSSGNEVEVTVVGRIQVSADRIVDLSADVSQAIGLRQNDAVRIYISQAPAPVIAEAVPEPEPEPPEVVPEPPPVEPAPVIAEVPVVPEPPPPAPEPVAVVPEPVAVVPEPIAATPEPAPEPQQPISITLHTYIVTPENAPVPPTAPPPQTNNTVVPREDINRQPQQPPVSATNNPELNWLAWLSYMTALSQAGSSGTVHVLQQQTAPPPVQVSPPSAQYIPLQSPPSSMQYIPLQTVPPAPVQSNVPAAPVHSAPVQTPPAQTHTTPVQTHTAPVQTHTTPVQTHTAPVQNNTPAQIVPTHGHTAAPVPVIRVIPYMPEPDSDIVYQLQLGAYSSSTRTSAIIQYLREAGFTVIQERTGDLDRVVITGISAPNVYNTIQRLGTMGFAEIWIRD